MRTRTFKKSFLPDSIEYKGKTLKLNGAVSGLSSIEGTPKQHIERLRSQGREACIVEVRNPRLRGKLDLHGKPYPTSKFIFST